MEALFVRLILQPATIPKWSAVRTQTALILLHLAMRTPTRVRPNAPNNAPSPSPAPAPSQCTKNYASMHAQHLEIFVILLLMKVMLILENFVVGQL